MVEVAVVIPIHGGRPGPEADIEADIEVDGEAGVVVFETLKVVFPGGEG